MYGFGDMIQKLKANPKTIVFPEGSDPRILEAASRLLAGNFLKPILLGNPDEINKSAEDAGYNIRGAQIIDPENFDKFDEMVEQFSQAFRLINAVVYIVIAMSAALAFVVLFTLASINVSERTREIATIKVLGFFDHEVHAYIDKETVILTAIGIVSGIPLGRAFASTLTGILNLPSIYLAVSLHLKSYLIAIGLTVLFAVFVNLFCDRILDAVDPVEALKSVE